MAVVDDLKTVEAMKSAATVFQGATFSAGLATPANPGHAEPSTDGVAGHSLSGAYEPGENIGDFVDALREHYWRVEYPVDPAST